MFECLQIHYTWNMRIGYLEQIGQIRFLKAAFKLLDCFERFLLALTLEHLGQLVLLAKFLFFTIKLLKIGFVRKRRASFGYCFGQAAHFGQTAGERGSAFDGWFNISSIQHLSALVKGTTTTWTITTTRCWVWHVWHELCASWTFGQKACLLDRRTCVIGCSYWQWHIKHCIVKIDLKRIHDYL